MASDDSFSRLVSLACHDLRTPLATVSGFAHTLERLEVEAPADRYIEMILAGSDPMADLLEDLALAARIEAGRFEPQLTTSDSRALVDAAVARLGERARAAGDGAPVEADRARTERSLAALALCAARHGGVDTVEVRAEGETVAIEPVTDDAAPVLLGEELKDLGAEVARRFFSAVGGGVRLEGAVLHVAIGPSRS